MKKKKKKKKSLTGQSAYYTLNFPSFRNDDVWSYALYKSNLIVDP